MNEDLFRGVMYASDVGVNLRATVRSAHKLALLEFRGIDLVGYHEGCLNELAETVLVV